MDDAVTKLLEKKGQDYDIGPKIKGKLEAVGYDMLYDLKQESPIGKWQRCWKRRLLDWIA
jgi:hypothetical protein